MSDIVEEENTHGIGVPVRRREDLRFITGNGNYTDDISQPGQVHALFCRSPLARANITSLDFSDAMQVPGVIACYSGKEMVQDEIGDLPCGWMVNSKDGSEMLSAPHPPLAVDTVNYVGEPFAIVIAESIEAARQGVDAAAVEVEE